MVQYVIDPPEPIGAFLYRCDSTFFTEPLSTMLVDKKYRGSLARCIPAYTHDLHDDLLRARPERVFITHSGCDPEVVEQVRTYLTSLNYFDAVIETRAGGVISCHCGPGTLGVLFILKE